MSNKTAPHIDETTGVRADSALVPPPADLPDFGPPALVPVDRSTLERYAGCCAQARYVELGRVLDRSRAADVGQEVHEAYSWTTEAYVSGGIEVTPAELADVFRGRLLQSRSDIQPEVLDAAYHCAWTWATFLAGKPREGGGIHPHSIEAFDGGEAYGKGGQLAVEYPEYGAILTSEIDFLYRGHAPGTLHERDWKSGRKRFSATSIYSSFQFQTHAVLVFGNYPEINRLEVTIEATRGNDAIGPVVFLRDDLPKFAARIDGALRRWQACRELEPEACGFVPSRETCPICPAATVCSISPPESVGYDPEAFLIAYYALDVQLDAMRSELTAYAKEYGDVRANGLCFGFDKPAAKPKAALYFEGGSNAADDDAER